MAQGEILLAAQRGGILPNGVGLDVDGRPTADPRAVLDEPLWPPNGRIDPPSIAFMIEILAGALAGGPFGFEDWRAGRNAIYQLAALMVGARLAVADE